MQYRAITQAMGIITIVIEVVHCCGRVGLGASGAYGSWL